MLTLHNESRSGKIEIFSFYLICMIILSTIVIQLINYLHYMFQGIIYLPYDLVIKLSLLLILIRIGSSLALAPYNKLIFKLDNFIYIFFIVSLISFYTSAIQLTPYSLIDLKLLNIDKLLHISTKDLLIFTYQHPALYQFLQISYALLNFELTIILLSIVIFYDKKTQNQFIFLLLFTSFVGFNIYYFFPTVAPAGIIDSPLFLPEQKATSLKFFQIHHYLDPTTMKGGLIAMPSFHTIWSMLCQYYISKRSNLLGYIILPLNVGIVIACLLLGWHYMIDILASIVIVLGSIKLSNMIMT